MFFDLRSKPSYERVLVFESPLEVYEAWSPENFHETWNDLQSCSSKTDWIAGFISYEAGYLWEESLRESLPRERKLPLFWMGRFPKPTITETLFFYTNPPQLPELPDWEIYREAYFQSFSSIHEALLQGETYQINFTFQIEWNWEGDFFQLFRYLLGRQKTEYACFFDLRNEIGRCFASLSPELFFSLSGTKLTAKPMKGTSPRSGIPMQDKRLREALFQSEKNRAENLMITDLLRNDMGKISKLGSVSTQNLFHIESYDTVHQMTSEIHSELEGNQTVFSVIQSLFPCGSVTGAPKIRSMKIIRGLENTPRGIYTGSMGYIPPKNSLLPAVWNVAIRTLDYDPKESKLTMGVGSGIVIDSVAEEEFRECMEKAEFLLRRQEFNREFYVFESMLIVLTSSGYKIRLYDFHLERLEQSCTYFQIPFEKSRIRSYIQDFVQSLSYTNPLPKRTCYRLRLQIDSSGKIRSSCEPFETPKTRHAKIEKRKIRISQTAIFSRNIYQLHKTSHRLVYDKAYSQKGDSYDILFLNEKGEVAETCVQNIFVKMDQIYYTPPLTSGILPGTLRRYVLEKFPRWFCEKTLKLEDLRMSKEIVVGNSIRGFQRVRIDWEI